jgi:hypothetical protein
LKVAENPTINITRSRLQNRKKLRTSELTSTCKSNTYQSGKQKKRGFAGDFANPRQKYLTSATSGRLFYF